LVHESQGRPHRLPLRQVEGFLRSLFDLMGGSQRSTEEKLHTVPVGERVWLSFHWTGPIESTAGTSYGAKQGGGELRLIETRPGGEVIDNALADYPHPTPAECVNSLAVWPVLPLSGKRPHS
jgi:hypothetical protein